MPEFTCTVCEQVFNIPQPALDKYPGWAPKYCRAHSPQKKAAPKNSGAGQKMRRSSAPRSATREENIPLASILQRYSGGPQDGLFTDGSCMPNPGQGGWGAVWVKDGEVVEQRHGYDPDTTNNRMEMMALIEALKMLDLDADVHIYTDSQLCVRTLTEWAHGWAARGWKKKSGPIKNLELVQEAYALVQERPNVKLTWIEAHVGHLWNEYADALATAWARSVL